MPIIRLAATALAGLGLLTVSAPAVAQALSPMRGSVISMSDRFLVEVQTMNPYGQRAAMTVHVYDDEFRPIAFRASPARMIVAPADTRDVRVVVPFEGRVRRKVRVCVRAGGVGRTQGGASVAAEVCGRFLARRLTPREGNAGEGAS